MAKIELPEADTNEHRFKKYDFENAKDLHDVLLNFNDTMDKVSQNYDPAMDGQRRWIFRGHWDSTWELTPTAFRKESYEKLVPKELKETHKFIETDENFRADAVINQISLECSLLRQFMETANNLGIECNYTSFFYDYEKELKRNIYSDPVSTKFLSEWPNSHILPVMALARHHGIPTRLLDFSYNSLFAAFFAASRPFFKEYINGNKEIGKKGNLCIWAMNEKEKVSPFLKKIYAPSNRSSNLFAQEGTLIMDEDASNNFIKNGEWQDFKDLVDSKHLIQLTLPQSKCKELLRLLWEHDITPARIMPNLDRATQTLEYTQWLRLINNPL